MKKLYLISLILLSTACSSPTTSPSSSVDMSKINSGKTLVTIGDTEIKEGLLEALSSLHPKLKAQIENPATRKKFIESIVEQQLLYQEAVSRGLDKSDAAKLRLMVQEQNVIAQMLMEEELNKAALEAYEKKKDSQFTKVNYSQIFIAFDPNSESKQDEKKSTPSKDGKASADKSKPITGVQKEKAKQRATQIKKRLSQGEDFAKIAEKESDDKATAKKGGEAGQVSQNDKRLKRIGLEKLADTIMSLKKDEVSDLFEGEKGYYIVKVTSDPIVTPFETAKKVIEFELQGTLRSKLVFDLKQKKSVKWDPELEKESVPEIKINPDTHPEGDEHDHNHSNDPKTPMKK